MEKTTVYVVRWPTERITKVGRTMLPARVQKFVNRGAVAHRLLLGMTEDDEKALLTVVSEYGRRTFSRWQESVVWLGAGGTGFSECYTLTDTAHEQFLKEVDHAYPRDQA